MKHWLGARAISEAVVPSSGDACLSWSLASEGRPGKTQTAAKYENCQAWSSGCEVSTGTWEMTKQRAIVRDERFVSQAAFGRSPRRWKPCLVQEENRVGFGNNLRVWRYGPGGCEYQ